MSSYSVESDTMTGNDRVGKMELMLGAGFIFFSFMKCMCFLHDGEVSDFSSLLKEENVGHVLT